MPYKMPATSLFRRMLLASALFFALLGFSIGITVLNADDVYGRYKPTWTSLDSRPLPKWYDEAKVGIFIHWGVFSVPSFGSEWFWQNWREKNISRYNEFMTNYPDKFTYQEFARDFTAEFFDAKQWATIFKKSGAQYVVFTSKHHEGFAMWPSKYSFSWNSVDVGPHRDIIGELSQAIRAQNLTFGLYHSLYEWFNPLWLSDKASNFTRNDFVEKKVLPEMIELIMTYKPSIFWSDGEWEASDAYWSSKDFIAWLYNESPVRDEIVINDRWGTNMLCKHGGFYTCADRFNPGVLQKHKWENAMTIDRQSWGYRRNANLSDFLTPHELITTLTETVSCGGNILINVGPTKEGTIGLLYQERLSQLGAWLGDNGEAIFATQPYTVQNDTLSKTWYTCKKDTNAVYAITLEWPENNKLRLGALGDAYDYITEARLVESNAKLTITLEADDSDNEKVLVVSFPDKAKVRSQWAWAVKFT